MRILITGGKGQLGFALQSALENHEIHIVDLPEVDITNRESVDQVVRKTKPELVIHCAAYTDVDNCVIEPDLAYRVNALGTQIVASACELYGAELLHISTNEVFSGELTGGYEEWMELDPINAYGHTKAAAERMVVSNSSQYYIVRTAWLYAAGGRNFIHAILNRAKTGGELRVVMDEVGNPTYARDLAVAIGELIKTRQYGVYHLVNSGYCSRWEFANEILRLANLQDVVNTPIQSAEYKRLSTPPPHGALNNLSGAALGIVLRPWQDALADYLCINGLLHVQPDGFN